MLDSRASARWQQPDGRLPKAIAGTVACLALGFAVSRNPIVAGAAATLMLGVVTFGLAGTERFTGILIALLPWLVLFLDKTPRLTLTVTAALAVLALLSLSADWRQVSTLTWVAVYLFFVSIAAQAIASSAPGHAIEAAKYALFPAMVLAVSSVDNRQRLVRMRPLLLGSGTAALATQFLVSALHLGVTNAYYGSGEQLGLTAESPHEIALVGVMVAIACLLTIEDVRWRLTTAAIAAVPAIATGVRSAFVALALAIIILALRTRFRPSTMAAVLGVVAAIIVSGAGSVVLTRYQQDLASGQYASLSTAGSDRGAVWANALAAWSGSGPSKLIFGTGLRSTEQIELQRFGVAVTAQSDPIAVWVELGIFGFAGWLLLWLALVRSGASWLVLVPMMSYAVSNGSLEYVGAVVFGIALAAACTPVDRLLRP